MNTGARNSICHLVSLGQRYAGEYLVGRYEKKGERGQRLAMGGTAILFITMCLLMGCATAPRMETASGRPEVKSPVSRAQMKSALVATLVDNGFLITADTEYTVLAEASAGGAADFWFSNAWTGEKPRKRVRLTLTDVPGGTRVIGTVALAHASGFSGRMSEEDYTNPKAYEHLQALLGAADARAQRQARAANIAP